MTAHAQTDRFKVRKLTFVVLHLFHIRHHLKRLQHQQRLRLNQEATMAARKQMSFQVIPTRIHGMIDYATGVLLLAAPYLFGFADGSAAQWIPMILGVATIGASLMTRYELGVFGLIPMPMHLMLDAGTAILLIASPWLFGFADRIYWPHVMVGVFELIIGVLSRTQPQHGPAYA